MERAKKRIAIIGGGISGLTAAYEIQKAIQAEDLPFDFILLEERADAGGMIRTIHLEGKAIDVGASAFDTRRTDIRPFLTELGLAEEIQYSIGKKPDRFSGHEFVHVNRPTYHGLPLKVRDILYDGELSWGDRFSVLINHAFNNRKMGKDLCQTTQQFLDYRFGRQVTNFVAYPHYAENVFGSLELCPPALFDPMLLRLFEYADERRELDSEEVALYRDGPGKEYHLASGMETLVKTLLDKVKSRLETSSKITGLQRIDQGNLLVEVNHAEYIRVGSVITTMPISESFKLLNGNLAGKFVFPEPDFSGMGTALFQFPKGAIGRYPEGYGFVIPKMSSFHTTKATILNRKWPAFADSKSDWVVLEFGRREEDTLIQLPDEAILNILNRELMEILRITGSPELGRVFRWTNAVAHLDPIERLRLADMEQQWHEDERGRGIFLGGSGLHGYGLPNAILEGKRLAAQALQYMRQYNGIEEAGTVPLL